MAKGVQRQIVLTKAQYVWITEQAKKLGVSEAEIIRRAVDEVRVKRG